MARSDEPPPPAVEDKEAASVNLFRNYELRTAFAPPERRRLPTTLVTGWLGSGKTTVMRHVLANRQDLKVACAVNDFAELNIDAELVARDTPGGSTGGADGDVVELTNGCLCCTLGGELETQVWKMLDVAGKAGVADPSAAGPIEYLLIETSGLVDPTETVLALDKTFGKLARVRLDSVVCVVDAESAAAGGVLGPEAFAEAGGDARGGEDAANRAWARQLAAADVVLLNKIDLLASPSSATEAGAAGDAARERLEAARAFVRKWAPEARVVETTRGRAPLPSILDVTLAPQPEGKFSHDWDSAARPFLLSPTGGGLRKDTRVTDDSVTDPKTDPKTGGPFVIHPAGVRRVKPSAHRAGVDGAAAFGSASFECGAVPLASFQRWVAFGIPRNAARAKGFVTFLEDPEVTYDFHLSGRRRVEIERAPAIPAGSRARRRDDAARRKQTRLVLIGPGVDPAASLDALREMREIPHSDRHSASSEDEPKISSEDVAARNAKVAERMRWARALVASDPRLELVEYHDTLSPPFSAAALAECVHFRLTGAALNGMSCETMEREHGVDFNRVNAEFVRALNAAGAGATATTATVAGRRTYFGSELVVARVAVGAAEGEGGCLEKWEEVGRVCAAVLQRHIAHIPKCRCGF